MGPRYLRNPDVAFGLFVTLTFAASYGLLMAGSLTSEIRRWEGMAAAFIGAALLVALSVGVWGLIELNQYLGYPQSRD